MRKSLSGLLPAEYNTLMDVNASQTVGSMFMRFMPHTDTSDVQKYFDYSLGEMPKIILAEHNNPSAVWNQPIAQDVAPQSIAFAMHDQALPEIAPYINFDPHHITAASAITVANIHYLGLVRRLAEHKQNDFSERMQAICDHKEYPQILQKLSDTHPEFAAHCPKTPYDLIITAEPENVVKSITSCLNKAIKYDKGVWAATPDMHRTSVGVPDPKGMTAQQWIEIRNQIAAYAWSGALGMQPTSAKDMLAQIALTGHQGTFFPACNFKGISYYPLNDEIKVGFGTELQFNLFSDEEGKQDSKLSAMIRAGQRLSRLFNHKDDEKMHADERCATNKRGVKKISPELYQSLKDGSFKECDKSYNLISHIIHHAINLQDDNGTLYVDMSKTDLVDTFIQDPKTCQILNEMIRPMPQKKLTL
jgi:hypothetical protein